MGTRSVIAIPDAEHGWKGRYVHWDGYPSGVGEVLRRIVNRDGYATAVHTLTQVHYGWSSLHPEQSGEQSSLGFGYTDGRFAAVAGYGTAYTTAQGQSSADDWILADGDDCGTEWAYLLGEGGIAVYERRFGTPESDEGHGTGMFGCGASDTVAGGHWRKVGFVAYTDAEGMGRTESVEAVVDD
jgi:hypothetical protein